MAGQLWHIRRATSDDARAIAEIHVRSSRAAYAGLLPEAHLQSFTVERREAGWRQMIADGACDVWIAEQDGQPLGWIAVGPSHDADAEPSSAELWAMYVDPPAWRRGVGRALWRPAETHLRAIGVTSVTLWVLAANAAAVSFYGALGFAADAGQARTRERGGGQFIDIRMRRDLEKT